MAGTPPFKIRFAVHFVTLFIFCILIVAKYADRYNSIYKPFSDTKSTECTTVNSSVPGNNFSYRCQRISVEYSFNGTTETTTMFENEEAYYLQSCSFHPGCPEDITLSQNEIGTYFNTYGTTGKKFPCQYLQNNYKAVIRVKTNTRAYFHVIFWPSVIAVLTFLFVSYSVTICVLNVFRVTGQGTQEVYELQTRNGELYCPCNDQCNLPFGNQEDFSYYEARDSLKTPLGVACQRCRKECLAGQFVNLDIQATSPFNIHNVEMWYRSPNNAEYFSFGQTITSRRYINPYNVSPELAVGDHIMWHRPYGSWRHAIVTEVGERHIQLIQWSAFRCCKIRIDRSRTDDIYIDSCCSYCFSFWKGDLYKVSYHADVIQRNPSSLVVARARSLLGLTGYRFFSLNGENFATFCKTGVNFNHQYPFLLKRLAGMCTIAVYLNYKALFATTVFIKVLLSEAVEFYTRPDLEYIGATIVIFLELFSFTIDTIMIYKHYNITWRISFSFCSFADSSNDFKKSVWMRIFEMIFGAGGIIFGTIMFESLVQCSWGGFRDLVSLLLGVFGGLLFGTIGTYFGNVAGYMIAKYLCYQPNRSTV